jgi:hypothetical protein
MVYLHAHGVDGAAKPPEFPGLRFVKERFADRLRCTGRANVARKVHAHARAMASGPAEIRLQRLKIG